MRLMITSDDVFDMAMMSSSPLSLNALVRVCVNVYV